VQIIFNLNIIDKWYYTVAKTTRQQLRVATRKHTMKEQDYFK